MVVGRAQLVGQERCSHPIRRTSCSASALHSCVREYGRDDAIDGKNRHNTHCHCSRCSIGSRHRAQMEHAAHLDTQCWLVDFRNVCYGLADMSHFDRVISVAGSSTTKLYISFVRFFPFICFCFLTICELYNFAHLIRFAIFPRFTMFAILFLF